MAKKKDANLILKYLGESFGNVDQICDEIAEAALQLAITPLESWTDYPAMQHALYVMTELREAFKALKPDVEYIWRNEDENN